MSGHGPELFDLLRGMGLPDGCYAVFGSGPLLARGVIDEVNDLDVICLAPAWEHARRLGEIVELDDGAQVVSTHEGAITFGTAWRYGEFDVGDLIATADLIDGLPFVRLEHVVAFKRLAQRPKDLEHLARLEAAGLTPP